MAWQWKTHIRSCIPQKQRFRWSYLEGPICGVWEEMVPISMQQPDPSSEEQTKKKTKSGSNQPLFQENGAPATSSNPGVSIVHRTTSPKLIHILPSGNQEIGIHIQDGIAWTEVELENLWIPSGVPKQHAVDGNPTPVEASTILLAQDFATIHSCGIDCPWTLDLPVRKL